MVAAAELLVLEVMAVIVALIKVEMAVLVDPFLLLVDHTVVGVAEELKISLVDFMVAPLLVAVVGAAKVQSLIVLVLQTALLLRVVLILGAVVVVELAEVVQMVEAVLLQLDGDSNNGTLR